VGLEPLHVPSISIVPATGRHLDAAVRDLGRYDWAVVTSANGARSIVSAARRLSGLAGDHAGPRWAAVGKATARVLREEGLRADFEPSEASAAAIAQELPVSEGSRVLIVSGDLAEGDLPAGLRARGADVHEVVAYRTREAPDTSRALLREAAGRRPDAALFTSGSTVRGLAALATAEGIDVLSIPAICIGPRTSAEARLAGFRVIAEAPMRDAAALAAATVEALAQQQEVV
jgi:uroporphyrinogen-III synthase